MKNLTKFVRLWLQCPGQATKFFHFFKYLVNDDYIDLRKFDMWDHTLDPNCDWSITADKSVEIYSFQSSQNLILKMTFNKNFVLITAYENTQTAPSHAHSLLTLTLKIGLRKWNFFGDEEFFFHEFWFQKWVQKWI